MQNDPDITAVASLRFQSRVLVHLDSLDESDDPVGIDAAQQIFPEVEIGYDGMELNF